MSSCCPATTAEVAAVVRLCAAHRVPLVPRGAGTGYTGGAVPTHGGVVLSLERMNRILEIDEANLVAVVEPHVITGDLQDAVEKRRPVLSARPRVAAAVGHRRQRRRVRRRAARVQVRHDEAVRARASGRAADRRSDPDRRQGREERRRLRPDAAAGRVRGHAGDHHARSSCGSCRSRRSRRRCARRFPTSRRPCAAVTNIIRARVVPAALELIDGDSLEAVARNLNVRSLAPEGTGGDAAARSGRHRAGGAGGSGARRGGVPRRRRHRGAAGARRGRAPGAVARPPRALAVAEDDHAAQVQPRRGRAEGTHSGAVRARAARSRSGTACASRASATPATATSTSTSWSTRRRRRDRARARRRRRALRGRRRARGLDQRRARHRLREGAVPLRSSCPRRPSRS